MERYGTARFVPANKISPKFKSARKFSLAEIIFCQGKKIFCDFCLYGTRKSVNENEDKENKNVNEF